MTAPLPFGTRLIGQTEKALSAILERILAPHDLSEPQWVTLTLALQACPSDVVGLARIVSDVTKRPTADAAARLAELWLRGYLAAGDGDTLAITETGRDVHAAIVREITPVTDRLWGDIDVANRDHVASVLNTVLHRAGAEIGSR